MSVCINAASRLLKRLAKAVEKTADTRIDGDAAIDLGRLPPKMQSLATDVYKQYGWMPEYSPTVVRVTELTDAIRSAQRDLLGLTAPGRIIHRDSPDHRISRAELADLMDPQAIQPVIGALLDEVNPGTTPALGDALVLLGQCGDAIRATAHVAYIAGAPGESTPVTVVEPERVDEALRPLARALAAGIRMSRPRRSYISLAELDRYLDNTFEVLCAADEDGDGVISFEEVARTREQPSSFDLFSGKLLDVVAGEARRRR